MTPERLRKGGGARLVGRLGSRRALGLKLGNAGLMFRPDASQPLGFGFLRANASACSASHISVR